MFIYNLKLGGIFMLKTNHSHALKCGLSLLLGAILLSGCNANSTHSDSPMPSDTSVQSGDSTPEVEVKTVYVPDSMLVPVPFATYTGNGDMLITFDAPCKPSIIRFEADSAGANITGYKEDDSSDAWVKGADKGETFEDIVTRSYTSCKVSCEGSWTLELYDDFTYDSLMKEGEEVEIKVSGTKLVQSSIAVGDFIYAVQNVQVDYKGDGFCMILGVKHTEPHTSAGLTGSSYTYAGDTRADLLLFTKQTTYSGVINLLNTASSRYSYLLVQCSGECTLIGSMEKMNRMG